MTPGDIPVVRPGGLDDARVVEAFSQWWFGVRPRGAVPDGVRAAVAASPAAAVDVLDEILSRFEKMEDDYDRIRAVHTNTRGRLDMLSKERDDLTHVNKVLSGELEAAVRRTRMAEQVIEELRRRARKPARATDDVPGQDLRPDPGAARTPAELAAALREFRMWAGNPSFREMAQRSGRQAGASTMCEVLNRDDLPERLSVVEAIIAGCGGGDADRRRFATAWRKLTMAGRVTATVDPALSEAEPPGKPEHPPGALRRLTAAG